MSLPARLIPRLRPLWPSATAATPSRAFSAVPKQTTEEWPQRSPLGSYYETILNNPSPMPPEKPEEPPKSAEPEVPPPAKESTTKRDPFSTTATSGPDSGPQPQTPQERAKIVFGSRLLGPVEVADRLAARTAKSTYIAGVLVPPRPEEPDNCCMSGCVNCVWDGFREDMEEWKLKNTEAQVALQKAEGSMDSDGGGSESSWSAPAVGGAKIAKDLWDDQLYDSVPVGIKEFMKQEKRLKERHAREGTSGG
ncbi:hypothetical protein FZEAL_4604 [Fusarium zealandicum]|uniref:Oxidoreductase-like domain-containing protein n=1 Tax=Fusarium zealandicum TaxID=1053134 RepID=A0A8H4XKM5_9HYPO|nr:hypothetical protein FZEAL_4604 [Fusarium zealandicum]